jgi:hypothetical protein
MAWEKYTHDAGITSTGESGIAQSTKDSTKLFKWELTELLDSVTEVTGYTAIIMACIPIYIILLTSLMSTNVFLGPICPSIYYIRRLFT